MVYFGQNAAVFITFGRYREWLLDLGCFIDYRAVQMGFVNEGLPLADDE